MKTQVRVLPLKSSDKISQKYSLSKALAHDLRRYEESHIDKDQQKNNLLLERWNENTIYQRLEKLKHKYGMVCKNSTIDVANYIFTVNKDFFDSREKKEMFLLRVNDFLKKECGEDAVLGIIGHDDEDGFHVHAYAVPLHKTTFKNRYSQDERIVINYRGKYSHSKQELMQYRERQEADKTKTGELQTRWAEFVQKIFPELERGERQSGKRNIKPKEYREIIEKVLPELEDKIESKNNELQSISIQTNTLKETAKELKMKIEKMNIEKYRLQYEITEAEKKKQDMFRQIPIIEVVKMLGAKSYPAHVKDNKGKTRKITNTIDYLIYVQGMTFSGAIKFLQENFNSERVSKTVEEKINQIPDNNEKPKYITIKEEIIENQLKALGNPIVRITVQRKNADGNKEGFNLGRMNKDKEEYFFNSNQILERIPQMNKLNSEGYNIYITPIEFEQGDNFTKKLHFLVDDVTDIEKLKKELGEPNLIIESSKGSIQAIYMIDNPIDYNDTKKGIEKQRKIYIDLFTSINKIYGDKSISGLRHPFRLGGYANKKSGREDVWVKILEANPNAKNNLEFWMQQARATLNTNQEEKQEQAPK